ncbi:MAG: hypothetical protein ACRDL2_11005 [Gaiellaceae bacterium]
MGLRTRDASYSQVALARCLDRHHISEESHVGFTVAKPSYRKLFPPGITGSITVPPPAGTSSRFDHALLYFFRTDQLALSGRARLVATFFYARGVPLIIAAILQIHGVPSGTEVDKLNRVIGNVVVLWEYPRHHSAASNRILSSCLAVSRK